LTTELETGRRLAEAEDVLRAIGEGEVDAFVISGADGKGVFTVASADRLYRMFVESMRDGAATLSSRGVVLYANESLAKLLSRSREELVGSPFSSVVVGDVPSELARITEASLDGATIEVELLGADDCTVPVLIGVSPLDIDGDRLVCLTVSDLRGQKELEKQLRQSQRMEAIGSLAGGIAHDFNNMLTVILGYCSVLSGSVTDAASRGAAERIDETAERAKALTTQLLAFSRQQVMRPEITDADMVAESVMRMLEAFLGASIVVERQSDRELRPILIDRGQLGQVILNLAVNARDAMDGCGTLSIQTRNVTLGDADLAIERDITPGHYVLLEVRDTGTGMNEETRSRAFDPFFTTKSGGTGLGLSTVYGIVKQSGGHASLESVPGSGTTFKLYFPAFSDRRLAPRPVPAARPSTGDEGQSNVGGTILLVDDDEAIRILVASYLDTKGYTVLAAGAGEEAVAMATGNEMQIDLLLTDIAMPGMSGNELGAALAALQPGIHILYTSGYPFATAAGQGINPASFIQKPYRLDELEQRIGETLRRRVSTERPVVATNGDTDGSTSAPPDREAGTP